MAPVLVLHGEGPIAEDAGVALELGGRGDFFAGCPWSTAAGTVEARVVAALGGAVADVTSSFVAAVDPLIVLGVGRFTALAGKNQARRRQGFDEGLP